MPSTSNKGLEVQTTGSNSGTWGDVLNNQMISYVDLMLGGTLAQALSAVNVTLSASDARYAIVRFTGVLLANITVTTPCLGFTIFDNATTGSFTVTIQYTGGIGSTCTLVQSALSLVATDATNGARLVAVYPDLAAIEALTGTGILKRTGTNTWSLASGVTDLAATTANRLFGTDIAGASGLITTDASLAVAAGVLSAVPATQTQMEAQASTAPTFASVQKYHPGHPKAWVNYNMATQTVNSSFGVNSVTFNSTGTFTVNFTAAFSSATAYGCTGWARYTQDNSFAVCSGNNTGTKSATAMSIVVRDPNAVLINSTDVFVAFYGDLA